MIREITEESGLVELGEVLKEFYKMVPYEQKEVNVPHWASVWMNLLTAGVGRVLGLWTNGLLVGGIGILITPSLEDGTLVAQEAFWFVTEESRGGGMKLFIKGEELARSTGAERMHMIHLSNSMPDKLKKLYERRGYREIETTYMKEF
jgi:hypothetical protein